ncbi:MAG TPA: hypothetical protein VGK63_09925 [Candidatus Limnocylindrales bacterium]
MASDPLRWWATKVRQFGVHLFGRVRPTEREAVAGWLTPAQLDLFDGMHRADRRHGLDVVRALRRAGVADREVLVAGLLHDCGKGRVGVVPRVVHSLGEAYGSRIRDLVGPLPGMRPALDRLARHAELSAELTASAGCSERIVGLIRWQETPRDPEFGRLLKLADEAS